MKNSKTIIARNKRNCCLKQSSIKEFKLYLFYNDYETSYTTYINQARWHRCLRSDGLRV